MTITLASMFRNSEGYVDRYFAQVDLLREQMPVRLVVAEGDSTDDTHAAVAGRLSPGDDLLHLPHGGPRFGSVDNAQRWDQIASVLSSLLGKVGDPGDAFVWVESDLVWKPEAITGLLFDELPAVAPMVYAGPTQRFYDVWGYRKHGARFEAAMPYYPGWGEEPVVPIDSCGSCFVARPETYPDLFSWSGHWPFTAGGKLWLDTRIEVRHP